MSTLDRYADGRSGDKGDTLIVAVLPRSPGDFQHLRAHLTEQAVAEHFHCDAPDVTVREVPTVESFVCGLRGVLGGGVTGSPVLDGHGKTLSYHMLTLPVPDLDRSTTRARTEHENQQGEQQ